MRGSGTPQSRQKAVEVTFNPHYLPPPSRSGGITIMLTQIRHIQKGVLIAVTVIIVISFAVLYSDYDFVKGSLGRQNCYVSAYDRCYRLKEFQKLSSYFEVAAGLGMYDFATVLFGERRRDSDPTDFVLSLIVLRKEAERLGIEPSAAEIRDSIPKLPLMQQPWVNADFLKNQILGPNGFTEGDLSQLAKDYLCYQRLQELITAGVEPVPSEAAKRYIQSNQLYTISLVRFDREAEVAKVKLTDEDIKKYYEENKDTLTSEPKRGFDYVKFAPKALPEDATNEAKAKAKLDFANAVNRAYADLAATGADFGALAKQYSGDKANYTAETGSLEPFAPTDPPALFKDKQEALEALFNGAAQVKDVSVPIEMDGGAYLVVYLREAVEPTPLTLEQATPGIREALIARRSNTAANDAASAALAKINEAVTAGKSFAEAAAGLGLKVESLPAFSQSEPPADLPEASLIVGAVSKLGVGETSGVTERPGAAGYLLAHVDKLEIYKDAEADAKRRSIAAASANQLRRSLFTSWLNQRRKESNSRRPEMLPPAS